MTKRPREIAHVVALRPAAPGAAGLSDAALVAAVRAGDRPSTLELYRRFVRDAERMIVRIVGFAPDRADLLHDVFVRAIEGIGGLREPSSVRSWIMGIAILRAREHIRARKRTFVSGDADAHPGNVDPQASMELRRVYALLERIDADDRIAFVLRRIERMELAEIADACQVSLATVKRRIARAEESFTAMAHEDPFLCSRIDRRHG